MCLIDDSVILLSFLPRDENQICKLTTLLKIIIHAFKSSQIPTIIYWMTTNMVVYLTWCAVCVKNLNKFMIHDASLFTYFLSLFCARIILSLRFNTIFRSNKYIIQIRGGTQLRSNNIYISVTTVDKLNALFCFQGRWRGERGSLCRACYRTMPSAGIPITLYVDLLQELLDDEEVSFVIRVVSSADNA